MQVDNVKKDKNQGGELSFIRESVMMYAWCVYLD
jgi:hypothetical protein